MDREEQILRAFEASEAYKTLIDPEINIGPGEDGTWWVFVDNHGIDVGDPGSTRIFSVVKANTGSSIDFEEV